MFKQTCLNKNYLKGKWDGATVQYSDHINFGRTRTIYFFFIIVTQIFTDYYGEVERYTNNFYLRTYKGH